jgi:hypothetical protein
MVERGRSMEVFGMAGLFGLILGFMFGVGCAFAVLYTIYMGGYRKGIEEGLSEPKPERYLRAFETVRGKSGKKAVR